MRENTVRGPAVDLGEFERRLRGPERKAPAPGAADPLSELARLMQGEEAAAADPYSRILVEPRAPRAEPHADPYAPELRGSYDAAPPVAPEPRHYDPRYAEAAPEPDYGAPAYEDAAYDDDPQPALHGAEGGWNDDSHYLDYGQSAEPAYDAEPPRRGGWLRPWHAIAAIGVIAVGSVGWAIAHRNGAGSKEIATITAPEGPVKVKPAADADSEAPATGAAVLDRKDNEPVKQIVTNQEQAVEPTVVPKTVRLGNGPVDAPHEAAPVPLGAQPRKVKTVTVRPDGTRVEETSLPPAVAKAARPPEPPVAAPAKTATPPAAPVKTATPKVVKPKPPAPAKPAQKLAATEESAPAEPAPEQDTAADPVAAPVSKGGYAVQFGAAASEAEAKAMVKTVSAKYGASLGGRKPAFAMATVGEKTVYRVRVGGVSKESAAAICGKVKAGGGSCFVAGN